MDHIPIKLIEENSLRVGGQAVDVSDLIHSFENEGQLSPIMVRPSRENGSYQVVYGNRRLAAARTLGWKTILAEIVDINEVDALRIAFSENVNRKDFSDYERGLLLVKLRRVSGKTYEEISKMIGRSPAYVSQHVCIPYLFDGLSIDQDEKEKVLCALTERQARVLNKIEDVRERWNTAKLAVASGFCARELERIVRVPSNNKKKMSKVSTKRNITGLLGEIVDGINRKDLRAYFQSRSLHYYSLFDDFPPFYKMDRSQAEEQNCKLHRLYNLKVKIQDIEIKVIGSSAAFATMNVGYEIGLREQLFTMNGRATIIFAREKAWKIIHEHWSLPQPIIVNEDVTYDPVRSSLLANLVKPQVLS
jgi:ParB/RepB/Spo0J family partition protein